MDFTHIATALASMPQGAMAPRYRTPEEPRRAGVRARIRSLYASSPSLAMESHELASHFRAPLNSVKTHLCALHREGILTYLYAWRGTGRPWGSLECARTALKSKLQRLPGLFTADPRAYLTSEGIATELGLSLNYVRNALAQLHRAGALQLCVIWVRA